MAPGMEKKGSWCHRYLESEFTGFSDSTDGGIEGRKWVVSFWLIGNRVYKTRRMYD